MSLYCATGSETTDLTPHLSELFGEALDKIGLGSRVLAIPPDITRLHSQAGALTQAAWRYYGDRLNAVLPALGTHTPLRPDQISHMFGDDAARPLSRP